jgi:hypothetical protein
LGAVRLAFRAELRRRWRSWLAIAILISVVGGLVLAATAAGRRTESAFPRFVAAHGFDAVEFAVQPVPKLAKLPGVTSTMELVSQRATAPTRSTRRIWVLWSHPPGGDPLTSSSRATCLIHQPPTRCWHRSRCNKITEYSWGL